MEGNVGSPIQGESQIAQTIGLDELPTSSQSQTSQRVTEQRPWGRLFPLNFLFGDNPHDLWEDVITVGRAEDCTIVLEKTKRSSKGETFTDAFYKAYSKVHFRLTRNNTTTGSFTFIEDCSSNGTFVNGCKLGKGTKQFLSNNEEIAICDVKNRLFVYMETVDEKVKENVQVPDEIDRQFTIGKVLGTGAYGEVRLGFEKNSCRRVAVKIIHKEQLTGSPASQEAAASPSRHKGLTPTLQTKREIEILRAICHPCVIRVEAVAESALAFYVVLELAEGGDLHTRLRNAKEPIGERLAKFYFLQITSAVDYLHQNHITHRDLKPENILLMTLDKETVCKVTDFGLAKLASTMSSMTTFCGTPLFVAPEVIVAQGNASYTSAVDLWSLGVLLYLCLVSELPFRDGRGDLPLSQQILGGSYTFLSPRWSKVSTAAKSLISQFLQVNPKRRISAGEALHAEWLDDEYAKASVDNLVHGTPPESPPPPQFVPKAASGREGRSVTPTVANDGASASRDTNDNRVADAAVDRPIETIVAAANYAHKRRSAHLHQSSSSENAGSGLRDGCGRDSRSKEKRMRLDP